MPTRKQRRRREKGRRHEYEYVWVDDEGQEVEYEREAESARARTNGRRAEKPVVHRGRKVEPPSWRRVLKRALIFAPFMFVTITLIDRNASIAARALQTAWLLALFIPFSYLMDRMMYRRFASRADAQPAPRRRSS